MRGALAVAGQLHEFQRSCSPFRCLFLRQLLVPQSIADILLDIQVREKWRSSGRPCWSDDDWPECPPWVGRQSGYRPRMAARILQACAGGLSCRSRMDPAVEKNSPRRMSNETPSTALTVPKSFDTSLISITVPAVSVMSDVSGAFDGTPRRRRNLRHDHDDGREHQDACAQGQHSGQLVGKAQLAEELDVAASVRCPTEEGEYEFIERDDEAQEQARDDAPAWRAAMVTPQERHPGILAEIARGFLQALVEAFERDISTVIAKGMQMKMWLAPTVQRRAARP